MKEEKKMKRRSVRLSEKNFQYVDQYTGKNFTDKLENLIQDHAGMADMGKQKETLSALYEERNRLLKDIDALVEFKAALGRLREQFADRETAQAHGLMEAYRTDTGYINDMPEDLGMEDRLFLLSAEEVETYLPKDEMRRNCNGTPCWWWLRPPGPDICHAAFVDSAGSVCRNGEYVSSRIVGVVPALHLPARVLASLPHTDDSHVLFGKGEWQVLNENSGLLLAKDAVCLHRFDENSSIYGTSEIRGFLNSGLLHDLFTEEEINMIAWTELDGGKSRPDSPEEIRQEEPSADSVTARTRREGRSREEIRKDVRSAGMKPTKQLVDNIQSLDRVTGRDNSLKDVCRAYKSGSPASAGEKELVGRIAEECRAQQTAPAR